VKSISILIPHYRFPKWIAVAVHRFKQFQFPLPWELVVCDNSPGHDSIKILTETDLGKDVKIVSGQPDFPSHGKGYFKAYQHAEGDWIFTAESDSFPVQDSWGNEYVKASATYDFIAPIMPMAAGSYGHPAGALVNRSVLDLHKEWRKSIPEWLFCPGAAPTLNVSSRGYHVIANKLWLLKHAPSTIDPSVRDGIELWRDDVGPWQEHRSFDDDTFETYGQRTGILNWHPTSKDYHLRIGYEPGQHLWYFAKSHGVKCMEAPVHIQWIPGWEGRQADYSDVFGGFRHVWCGSSAFGDATDPTIKAWKVKQMNDYFSQLPEDIQKKCAELEIP
jgi:hypothetical protein